MPKPNQSNRIEAIDAKAGSNEGVVRWVLLISLVLAVVAMTAIWVTGALSQDSVESAGTATAREDAEADLRNEGGAQSDMGVMSPDTVDDTIEAGAAGAE